MGGVGIDLIEIERMERALARRPRLADRLFTAAERSYAAGRARPAQHLAARFCAKEAVSKALAADVLRPLEIEVSSSSGGAPSVVLHGETAEFARSRGVQRIDISLTHSSTMAGAVAMVIP